MHGRPAAGRVIGVITMGFGISAFAVVTAKMAEFLVRTRAEDDRKAEGDVTAG